MLELANKDFRLAITKMLKAKVTTLETNDEIRFNRTRKYNK